MVEVTPRQNEETGQSLLNNETRTACELFTCAEFTAAPFLWHRPRCGPGTQRSHCVHVAVPSSSGRKPLPGSERAVSLVCAYHISQGGVNLAIHPLS